MTLIRIYFLNTRMSYLLLLSVIYSIRIEVGGVRNLSTPSIL